LVLENCEKCYSIEDCLRISNIINIPVVFDTHHYNCYKELHPNEIIKYPSEYVPYILESWKRRNIKPKFHISEQGCGRIGHHSDFIETIPDYLLEIPYKYNVDIDIMIEAKMKEQAIFKLYNKYPELNCKKKSIKLCKNCKNINKCICDNVIITKEIITKEKSIIENSMNLQNIKSSDENLKEYINRLNKNINSNTSVKNILFYAKTICNELPKLDDIYELFKNYGIRDKGNLGKIIEYGLFNQKPNSDSNPDLFERDIKVTKFKKIKVNNYNAKERLTLTNIGNTLKDNFGSNIVDNFNLKDTKYYKKIRKGLLIIVDNGDKKKYKTFDDVMNQRLLYIINYDIEELPTEYKEQINKDYINIRERIINKDISQKGQIYLHIHPHGNKSSSTRAFGFTNKFITKLLAYYLSLEKKVNINDILINNGRSFYIKQSIFD